MVCIGSSNYLSLSPYKISNSNQIIPKSFASHWFLIQVISSIINIYSFGNSEKIYFSSENMVANGWFKMYLNQNQFNFLKDSTYFKLYPIESKNKIFTPDFMDKDGFYVHASKDWVPPPGTRIISRISDTIFYVDNIIINQEIQNDPRVLRIQSSGLKEPLNRFVSGFLQSGHQKSIYSDDIFAPIRPLHKLGLNGSNQIINVVDSGVDVFNAFFYDPDPENNLSSITGKTNVNHRKVVRIEPIVDNTDEERGHGTHVAGTACGSSYCSTCGISQYNGIAPSSKLYFSDIGNSTSGDLSGHVDLNEQYEIFKELGVHVSSNSWGYSYSYREVEFSYNKAAFDHPQVLYVFAAGNSQAYNTINCPGNTKNVLSVSAANFISSSYLYYSQQKIEIFDENNRLFDGIEITDYYVFQNSVADPMKYYINLTLKPFSEDVEDDGYYKGSVVIFNNETGNGEEICQIVQKVALLGAEAAIFVTDETKLHCDEHPSTIPVIKLVNKENISVLFDVEKVSLLPYSGTEKNIPTVDLLSSKGPADSGLRKPDITIPGSRIFSARSHGPDLEDFEISTDFEESVHVLSGSSMATPQASALALIIIQYLAEGFYPNLEKNPENSIQNSSSCLLRAFLVNTAIKPNSVVNESKSFPRNDVGFGTPFLHKILGFNDTGLRFVDNEKIGPNSHRVYRIKIDSNLADLSVTLVYLDPPLDVDNEALLFADLDLYVKSPNGQIYNGNNVSDGDTLSVIERVVFDKSEIPSVGVEFEIHVVSNKFPIESQNVMFSIVVNGPFDMKNIELNPLFLKGDDVSDDENVCPNECSRNGKCEKGQCVCNDGFVGLSCGTELKELKDGESYKETLNHGDLSYFRIPLKENDGRVERIDFDVVKGVRSGYVYFCTSFEDSPGKLTNPGWNCHLACPKNDPDDKVYPLFANYSFETPKDQQQENDPKFFNLAFYTGYYKPQNITINNIKLTFDEEPTDVPTASSQSSDSLIDSEIDTLTFDSSTTETESETTTKIVTESETATKTVTESTTSSPATISETATKTVTETESTSSSKSVSLSSTLSPTESENSNHDDDKSITPFAMITLVLVSIMVFVAVALVPFLLCKRNETVEAKSSMSISLLSQQDI